MAKAYEISRDDEVVYKKVDQVSPYLKYVGRADFGVSNPATSAAVWQILRVTIISGVETKEYAKAGEYTAIWDSRSSYFAAFTNPKTTATQGALTVSTTAVAVRVGGSDLADRKVVTLTNNSTATLYWGWTSGVTTSSGTPIAPGSTVTWCVEGNIPSEVVGTIYVIAASGSNNTRVTESP